MKTDKEINEALIGIAALKQITNSPSYLEYLAGVEAALNWVFGG